MKKILLLSAIIFIFISSCNNKETEINKNRPIYPNTGSFYQKIDTGYIHWASPIIYDVIVKNPDPSDQWQDYCLQGIDMQVFANVIFNAVYQGKLTPYYYRIDIDSVLPLDSVRAVQERFGDKNIGKLQFNEDWYFDEQELKMYKRVNSITFGYEKNMGDHIVYAPAFKVFLDKQHNNQQQTTK
jgi:hypothetical protein